MNCEKIEVLISGYLDNELTQQERQLVSIHIEDCQSCANVHKELKDIKEQMGSLSYPKSDIEILDALENDLVAKTSAGIGWFLFVMGFFLVSGMVVIEFVTAENTPWYEKLIIALITMAPLSLLVSVVRQRMLTYKNDKYRKVKL